MIPRRGKLFLVKRRSLARRLSASRPSFVAPTGLRHLPRLRPHPRLDLRPRRARSGFPSPVASYRSCPTIIHAKLAVRPLRDRAPSGVARLPRTPSASSSPSSPSSCRSPLVPSAPDPRPHTSAIIANHDVISILSFYFIYRSSSATPTPAPLLRRAPPTPVNCLFLPWQYYCSCALFLPFSPRALAALSSCLSLRCARIVSSRISFAPELRSSPQNYLIPSASNSVIWGNHSQVSGGGTSRRSDMAGSSEAAAAAGMQPSKPTNWGSMTRKARKNWKQQGGRPR